jgi:hypothetical protein
MRAHGYRRALFGSAAIPNGMHRTAPLIALVLGLVLTMPSTLAMGHSNWVRGGEQREAGVSTNVVAPACVSAAVPDAPIHISASAAAQPGSDLVMRNYCPVAENVRIYQLNAQDPDTPEELDELNGNGWYQRGDVDDNVWQRGSTVWWPEWEQAIWRPGKVDCGEPVGLRDAAGNPLGKSDQIYLCRYEFDLQPPQPGMEVRRATLQMWSDNQSQWWFDGDPLCSGEQGHLADVALPALTGTSGGKHLIAARVDNDHTCLDNDYCNPHGLIFELIVVWARPEHRRRISLPITIQSCQPYQLIEEFDDDALWTATPAADPFGQINEALSGAEIDCSKRKTRYLWQGVSGLEGRDLTVTIAGTLSTDDHTCGVAIALRNGSPQVSQQDEVNEEHIIDQRHPGVLIALAHDMRFGPAFDHIYAEWFYPNGSHDTTQHGQRWGLSPGEVIRIRQDTAYVATLQILSSQEKAVLTVQDGNGNLVGSLTIKEADYREPGFAGSFGALDTLIIGNALPWDERLTELSQCAVWIDSVTVHSAACTAN